MHTISLKKTTVGRNIHNVKNNEIFLFMRFYIYNYHLVLSENVKNIIQLKLLFKF